MRQHVQQEQLPAFLAWLPSELRNAPGIDWSLLPASVRGYCLRSLGTCPDAPYLVLAAASACGAISPDWLIRLLRNLHSLLRTLRTMCGMEHVLDLQREALWNEFAAQTQPTRTRGQQLSAYSMTSSRHYPRYLAGLSDEAAALMRQYQLPPLPAGFLRPVSHVKGLNIRRQNRSQLIRETLLPLVPALCELVFLRKRAMAQILDAFHHAQQQVTLGASLPLGFELSVLCPSLSQQNGTWKLQQQGRTLHFRLWNKRSWVLEHRDRYRQSLIKKAECAQGPYAVKQEQYFVEFKGEAHDLLWYGDLVELRLLQHLSAEQKDPTLPARQELARALGCSFGCATGISGLLQPDMKWLAFHAQAGDLLFEPEALFRGTLYGAALVTLALASGGSTGELLQISAERWVRDPEGTFQRLVPERARADEELLLEISPQAMHLLQEIEQGLVKKHGNVPVVTASHQVARFDLLRPERYLFQWKEHMLSRRDTEVLVLFLLHGVDIRCTDGTSIPLTLDQLRLGGNVPLEERARALKRGLGFNQTILKTLSRSTLDAYCRTLYAYFDFAGSSYEAALQPLTLARWMVQMLDQCYERETVNGQASIVQHLFREAEAQGFIERNCAAALQGVEEIPVQTEPATNAQDTVRPHLRFSLEFKKCRKLNCSVCQEGDKQGHGPYWYGFWYEDGQQHSFYIGRVKNARTIAAALKKKKERLQEKQAAELARDRLNEDVLAPLVPALSQLVTRRVQLSETVLAAIREAQLRQVGEGSSLPYRFQFATTIPELDPSGVLRERAVVLRFLLWDKHSWVARHPERFSRSTIDQARSGTYAYSEQRNTRFVQFHGYTHNALWFGDLLEHALLRKLDPERDTTPASKMRNQYARERGFPRGGHTSRPGLLDSTDRWFADNARRGELVFEPEALHRGILYGAALVLLSLLDGLETMELLQVSADRWVELHTEAIRDERGQAGTTRARYAQELLPSGARTGSARRLYPISAAAKDLLDHIAQKLVDARGEILVVQPGWSMTQQVPSIRPDRYLFQQHASPDGKVGILHPLDITVLVRFVLYGTPFSPEVGTWPSTKLLRLSAPLPAIQQERTLKQLRDTLLAPLAPDLKPSSLQSYRRHLLAYLRYAGSAERAYQPETLRQWIEDLANHEAGKHSTPDAIDQKATVVRRCMAAAAELGHLDQERARAFGAMRVQRSPDGMARKRGPAPKVSEERLQWLANLWYDRPGLTGEALRIAYFLEFDESISTDTLSAARARLNLGGQTASKLTAEDEEWIAEHCRQTPVITARELKERIETERGKKIGIKELNRIRASLGLRRPSDSPPRAFPERPVSYKLSESDYAWLLQQKRGNPELSAARLRHALRKQRGKEIGERAINTILHKHGLSTGRGRRSQQLPGDATTHTVSAEHQQDLTRLDGQEKLEPSKMHSSAPMPKQKRRDHRRRGRSQELVPKRAKVVANRLSPAALGWLVKRCRRDPAISNEDLQTLLKPLGFKVSIVNLEKARKKLGIPRT